MPKAQQSRVNMYVKLSSKTGLSALALSKDVFQNKPWTQSASGHLPKTKILFSESKTSIKQWKGSGYWGVRKREADLLQNQQANLRQKRKL
jgi:hypothetical protein